MRTFSSGATRDDDANKLDYEGFLSPLVLKRYAEYLNKHRVQKDGNIRTSDNWQRGIPLDAYMKSAWRHFMDMWAYHRGHPLEAIGEEAICALLFNVMGYLHELLRSNEQCISITDPARLLPTVVENMKFPICGECIEFKPNGGECFWNSKADRYRLSSDAICNSFMPKGSM